VLYLLHGTSGGASDWTKMGDAEQTTAGKPLIVVMPDIALNDDGGGWCTSWPDGTYHWDVFHIDELVPWVQANLRTLNTRGERAIAGLSQGGFCSTSYAARFPNLFGVALSYSGAPDIAYSYQVRAGAIGIINATEVGLDHVAPNSMFGNPVTDYFNWAQHDPATLADNLRSTKLYMYFGNGTPGPLDTGPPNGGANAIEAAVYEDNIYFHDRLQSLGIKPVVYDYYGNGTHSWPYWTRDLKQSIGPIMDDFADPAPPPVAFSYISGFANYAVYGWRVAMHRQANEFSTLVTTAKNTFSLAGSGSATVTTPGRYAHGRAYVVTIHSGTGTSTVNVTAGKHGTLVFSVPLGPSDTMQEWSAGGPPEPSLGTTVYTTHVSIIHAPVHHQKHHRKAHK
jgi:S-formylglutathione hydrolase FrmB